jgi:N-acyl homoserine lactone hydrolase
MTVRIRPMVCGWLEANLDFLVKGEPGRVKLPIPSFLIEHPKGKAVFDSGLHRDLQRGTERIGALDKIFTVHYRAGEDLASRLKAAEVDPERVDYLINSHLHFDHVGGNADIPNAKLVVQRREWEAADDPVQVRRNGYNRADFDLGHKLQLVDGEHDLFGDGSVVCIPTYGHTAGHQSLRVRVEGSEVVLTADCCYMRVVLEKMALPGSAYDFDAMRGVIERLRKMERGGTRLIFGHDPAQWREDGALASPL